MAWPDYTMAFGLPTGAKAIWASCGQLVCHSSSQSLLVTGGSGQWTGKVGHPLTTTRSLPALIGPKTKQQPPRQSHSLQLGLMPPVHKLLAVGLSRQLERGWWYTAPGVLRQRVAEFRRHAFALTAIHLCSRRPYNVGSLIDRPVCGEFPPPAFWRGFNFRSRFSRFPTALPHWPQWNN